MNVVAMNPLPRADWHSVAVALAVAVLCLLVACLALCQLGRAVMAWQDAEREIDALRIAYRARYQDQRDVVELWAYQASDQEQDDEAK